MDQSLLALTSSVLVTVRVTVEVPPGPMRAGVKALSSCGVTSTIWGRSKVTSLPDPVVASLRSSKPNDGEVPSGILNAPDCSLVTWTSGEVLPPQGSRPVPSTIGVPLTRRLKVSLACAAWQLTSAKYAETA
ncbi:hypothetical protein PJL18_02473 [Paenarthrobacter nicotinovorans]|nr:hypothetical protein [Paenarthrobacter nicotinovorans]